MAMSGLAATGVALGSYMVWAGINNFPALSGLQALAQGRKPTARPTPTPVSFDLSASGGAGVAGTAVSSGTLGSRILAGAKTHIGVKYVFGKAGPDSVGYDCSGLVSYVLARDCGLPVKRMMTTGFLVWSGAKTVPWSQMAPGDLVCWTSHMGIATGDGHMVAAPKPGSYVEIDKIWRTPEPVIRRVIDKTAGATAAPATPPGVYI